MATAPEFQPQGVIPATLLAFDQDFEIDEAASRKHLADVAAHPLPPPVDMRDVIWSRLAK